MAISILKNPFVLEADLIDVVAQYIRHAGKRPSAEFVYDLAARMNLEVKDPYMIMQKAEQKIRDKRLQVASSRGLHDSQTETIMSINDSLRLLSDEDRARMDAENKWVDNLLKFIVVAAAALFIILTICACFEPR